MRSLFFLSLVIFFIGCKKNAYTYYKYKNITITRIDGNAITRFYYGYFLPSEKLPGNYIKVTYQGFDGIFSGYINFSDNTDSVTIVPSTNIFEQIGSRSKISIVSLTGNDPPVRQYLAACDTSAKSIFISDTESTEQIVNKKKENLLIKVIYPNYND
jgi:hypothetical protein